MKLYSLTMTSTFPASKCLTSSTATSIVATIAIIVDDVDSIIVSRIFGFHRSIRSFVATSIQLVDVVSVILRETPLDSGVAQ